MMPVRSLIHGARLPLVARHGTLVTDARKRTSRVPEGRSSTLAPLLLRIRIGVKRREPPKRALAASGILVNSCRHSSRTSSRERCGTCCPPEDRSAGSRTGHGASPRSREQLHASEVKLFTRTIGPWCRRTDVADRNGRSTRDPGHRRAVISLAPQTRSVTQRR